VIRKISAETKRRTRGDRLGLSVRSIVERLEVEAGVGSVGREQKEKDAGQNLGSGFTLEDAEAPRTADIICLT
jgi:hypothetical protein